MCCCAVLHSLLAKSRLSLIDNQSLFTRDTAAQCNCFQILHFLSWKVLVEMKCDDYTNNYTLMDDGSNAN